MGLDSISRMPCGGLAMKGKACPHVLFIEGKQEWDRLWDLIADTGSTGCCYILSLSGGSPDEVLSARVKVPDDTLRTVELRLGEGDGVSMNVELDLGKDASLGLLIRGVVGGDSKVKVQVRSRQNQIGSRFVYRGRLACRNSGTIDLATSGYVGTEARRGSCEYDTKILQVGTQCDIMTRPHLEVLGKEVIARHGCSVGRVPQSALVYMQSRGIATAEAEELFLRGFLS
jgi:Fe-S cluster assembly scaffold protein SufB